MNISTSEFRTRLTPGKYTATTDCTVMLFHGVDAAAREIEYSEYKAGQSFEVGKTMNGFWYGLLPNGDAFNGYEVAEVQSI